MKPLDDFYLASLATQKRQRICKTCRKETEAKRYQAMKSAYESGTSTQYEAMLSAKNEYGRMRRTMLGEKAKPGERPKMRNPDGTRSDYERYRRAELRQIRRDAVLNHYSGGDPKCACCGEARREFLAIDHIGGNGNQHRKEIGQGGGRLELWLVRNQFPEGFRVLCHNCNQARSRYGYCPHEQERVE